MTQNKNTMRRRERHGSHHHPKKGSPYRQGRRGSRARNANVGGRATRNAPVAMPRTNGSGDKVYIYGRHALAEALEHAPHSVRLVFLAPEMDDAELRALIKKSGIEAGALRSGDAGQMVGRETAHQGVVAILNTGSLMVPFDRFMDSLTDGGRRAVATDTMLVLLDELTDPHNVGAVIRSAAAFGAAGVLIPSHNQAPVTGVVVKTSAGMAFRIPLIAIGNVNQAVDALRKEGFKAYGLVMDGTTDIMDEPFSAPTLVVVGNEGEGIREKTLERCDVRLRIPMDPRAESLNASVSAAVVLYQWSVKHPL